MIKSITLHNFQSHSHTVLELSPGLNIIKGSSHHGKSAVIRGLRWVFRNRPRGDGFRSYFSKETYVSIEFNDGNIVTRYRSDKENYYRINNDEKKTYKALGSDVPPEIKKVLNVSALNLRSQDDKFFMLQDTPGNRAKQLNKIVGLEVIDAVLRHVKSAITENNTRIKISEEDIKNKKEKLLQYADVKKCRMSVDKIDKISIELAKKKERHRTVYGIFESLENKIVEKEEISDWLEIKGECDNIIKIVAQSKELSARRDIISDLHKKIKSKQEWMEYTKYFLGAKTAVDSLLGIQDKIRETKILHTSIQKIHADIGRQLRVRKQKAQALEILNEELGDLDICPTCGALICDEKF